MAEELARSSETPALWGRTTHGSGAPYAPVVAALRAYLRANPGGLDDCGSLRPHLALILPELGPAAPATDRATLFEAALSAFEQTAREPHVVVLDDLQWSDEATLAFLMLEQWDAAIEPSIREGPALLGFMAARIAEEIGGPDAYHAERARQTEWLLRELGL